MAFPRNFIWGAATASYQIEGAAYDDGKGLSVWDMFCRREGAVYEGNTGDIACDHYHRYKEDVALMKEVGLQAYRLSISWPRVLPEGVGAVNPAGLAFYDRLIDELLAHDITPFVTLFHWDFPYALYLRGGWLNRDTVDWFADYAALMVDKLGDRVKNWMTFNEPVVFTFQGHMIGRHAPGDKFDNFQMARIVHHVLVAHGKAVQVMRARWSDLKIGIASVGSVGIPASDDPKDVQAAHDFMFSSAGHPYFRHDLWCDPMLKGHYPEDVLKMVEEQRALSNILPGDMETIHQPLDFFGMNLYTGVMVGAGEDGKPELTGKPVGLPVTVFHWDVRPEALYWGARFLYERYKLPILITENGLSNPDWVSLDGKVHDPQRIDFTHRYLLSLRKAGEDGAELMGYLHWSIMDNFEWAEGMKHRFGLIHIDFDTQQRTIKDSAYWYRDVIASNGENL